MHAAHDAIRRGPRRTGRASPLLFILAQGPLLFILAQGRSRGLAGGDGYAGRARNGPRQRNSICMPSAKEALLQ